MRNSELPSVDFSKKVGDGEIGLFVGNYFKEYSLEQQQKFLKRMIQVVGGDPGMFFLAQNVAGEIAFSTDFKGTFNLKEHLRTQAYALQRPELFLGRVDGAVHDDYLKAFTTILIMADLNPMTLKQRESISNVLIGDNIRQRYKVKEILEATPYFVTTEKGEEKVVSIYHSVGEVLKPVYNTIDPRHEERERILTEAKILQRL